jgi:hypothetical protein
VLAPLAADAGIEFREVQVVGRGAAGPDASAALRLVREITAEGDNCRIAHVESTDPQAPAGTYILATAHDAFIIDPARGTISPVNPTPMVPAGNDAEPLQAEVSGVALELLYQGPGHSVLGLDTRHFIYRLRYQVLAPADAGPPGAIVREERHDFLATPWTEDLQPEPGWRAWRVAEDGGTGTALREVREAIEQMHRHGFMLVHTIERQISGTGPGSGPALEHVSREVTGLSRRRIGADAFAMPVGLTPAEILAPASEYPPGAEEAGDPGGAPAPHRRSRR